LSKCIFIYLKILLSIFQTGTLTEDGLDMWGVLPVEDGQFIDPCHNVHELKPDSTLPLAMAACQSLTIINRELMGDPLDIKVKLKDFAKTLIITV
jgi:magnesium-transporting ATPase (P-type)